MFFIYHTNLLLLFINVIMEKDQDDLPFHRGEVLTIIRKDEEQWWTARNSSGQIGQIPVPYIDRVCTNNNRRCM